MPATFIVTNTNDSGTGSFRQAIKEANFSPNFGDPDRIEFNIPGTGVHTIQPQSPLDDIVEAVVIDGYSQPGSGPNTLSVGNNAVLRIMLDGAGLSGAGLTLGGFAGSSTVRGLVISNFDGDGISVSGSFNTIQGNFIGTDAAGATDQGNSGSGININDAGAFVTLQNAVGGDSPADRNRIGFNGLDGVRVMNGFIFDNRILGNEIFDNDGLGIDLGGDGVTANDPDDFDFGANNLQNFPDFTSAVNDGQHTTITGSLKTSSFSTFEIRYYSSPTSDASNHGEGAVFLGVSRATTDGFGVANFTYVLPANIRPGDTISATATDQSGNTSEFSENIVVTAGPHPTLRTLDALILDINGDGLDLTGTVLTQLLNGQTENVHWTKSNSDDAFMLLDATSLRAAGFDVMDHAGVQLNGNTLFRDGLRVKSPDGKTTVVTDGWQLLGLFDSNKDGKVSSSDPAFQHLRLFTDKNADGNIGVGELSDFLTNVRSLVVPFDPVGTTDADGNRNENWPFEGAGGVTRMASNVWLAHAGGGSTAPRTIHWTGLNSNDWYDAGNWDLGDVPSMVDAAVIDQGVADHGSAVDLVARVTLHGGTLLGRGDGTFTVTRFTFTGGDLNGDGTTAIPAGGSLQFRGLQDKVITDHRVSSSGLATGRRQYDPIVLDLVGDGLDLSGRVDTDLLTGTTSQFRWTKINSDDVFLVVDASSLRLMTGEDLTGYDSLQLNGDVLFASGLRLRSPDGQDRIITDGWQLLRAFDQNNDGKVDANDPVWQHLKLFQDANADGAMTSPTELESLATFAESITLDPGIRREADGTGNTMIEGSFTRVFDGEPKTMADVNFGSFGRAGVPLRFDGASSMYIQDLGRFLADTGEIISFSGSGEFVNDGAVSVTFGGLQVENGSSTGTWDLDNDGVLDVTGNFEFNDGTKFNGNGLFRVDPANPGPVVRFDDVLVRMLSRVAVALDGSVWVGNDADVTFGDGSLAGEFSVDPSSVVGLSGNLEIASGTFMTGDGIYVIGSDAPGRCDVVVAGSANVSNYAIRENGSLTVRGHLTVTGELVVADGGYLTGVRTAREHGTGLATGRITGNVYNDSGTVDVILLTIDGDYAQQEDGTLQLEFGISEPGLPSHGQLAVTGLAYLAGRLILSAPDGFSAVPGTSFTLVKYGAHQGTFDRIDGLDLADTRISVVGYFDKELKGTVRAANLGPTFTDNDDDIYTVKLTGPGRASVYLADPDGDGEGAIQHILLTGTNGKTSKLVVTVTKKGVAGDGSVSIGSIEGSGIGGITAMKSNLFGEFGHGIELTGALGGLRIRSILRGMDVLAGGDPLQTTVIAAHVIENGTTIDLGTSISSLTAARITNGTIRAPRIGSLRVIGNRVGPIVGDFSGQVIVTGSGPIALGSVLISGAVTNSSFNITGGRVGNFSVGSFVDSTLFVGFIAGDPDQPLLGGTFTAGLRIDAFRVKGAFDGSTVAADTITTATIGNVLTNNGGEAFGLMAHTKFGTLIVTQPKLKLLQKDLPKIDGDFQVKMV